LQIYTIFFLYTIIDVHSIVLQKKSSFFF
jgi:hypothetical protein